MSATQLLQCLMRRHETSAVAERGAITDRHRVGVLNSTFSMSFSARRFFPVRHCPILHFQAVAYADLPTDPRQAGQTRI